MKAGIGNADELHTKHGLTTAGVNVINREVHRFQADIIGNFAEPGPMAGVSVCDELLGNPFCNTPSDTIPLLDIAVFFQLLAGFSDRCQEVIAQVILQAVRFSHELVEFRRAMRQLANEDTESPDEEA